MTNEHLWSIIRDTDDLEAFNYILLTRLGSSNISLEELRLQLHNSTLIGRLAHEFSLANNRVRLEAMLKAARLDRFEEFINQEYLDRERIMRPRYPVRTEMFETTGTQLLHLNRQLSLKHIQEAIDERGLAPCGMEQLLAFGAENAFEQFDYPIIALGAPGFECDEDDDNDNCYPYLSGGSRSERDLALETDVKPDSKFHEDWRFLVKPR